MPKSHRGSKVSGRKGANGTDAVTACASISAHRLAPIRSIASYARLTAPPFLPSSKQQWAKIIKASGERV